MARPAPAGPCGPGVKKTRALPSCCGHKKGSPCRKGLPFFYKFLKLPVFRNFKTKCFETIIFCPYLLTVFSNIRTENGFVLFYHKRSSLPFPLKIDDPYDIVIKDIPAIRIIYWPTLPRWLQGADHSHGWSAFVIKFILICFLLFLNSYIVLLIP